MTPDGIVPHPITRHSQLTFFLFILHFLYFGWRFLDMLFHCSGSQFPVKVYRFFGCFCYSTPRLQSIFFPLWLSRLYYGCAYFQANLFVILEFTEYRIVAQPSAYPSN